MQNKNHKKSEDTKNCVLSTLRISKYLSSGQLHELEELQEYKKQHDLLTYDFGDNWWL